MRTCDPAQLPQVFTSVLDSAVEYLGSQITSLTRNQVQGGSVWVLPWDRKEELVHSAVQNRGYGTGRRQSALILNLKDVGERVAHQRDWERGAACVSVVPKPEPISEQVRPIVAVRFFSHLVIECGKGWTGIATLIPLFKKGRDGAVSIVIAAIGTVEQASQTPNIERTAQCSGKCLDTDYGLVWREPLKPSEPVDGVKGIWHKRTRDLAVPLSMRPIGSRPIAPIDRKGIGRQVRQ